MPASFDLASVEAAVARTQFAGSLQHFETINSTSTLALEAAQTGAEAGVWIADEQTAGRGRGGHAWHSTAGDGLYVSVLVRPALPIARALWLSLSTGLAAQSAIAQLTGLQPDIRWPNDILLNGKKCGGILVETSVSPETSPTNAPNLRFAVIGIGINVNHAAFPSELSVLATSLHLETGKPRRREDLLALLLQALDLEIHLLETAPDDLLERFSHGSSWVRGKRVQIGEDGGYTGVTAGLNPDGFLTVLGDDSLVHTVLSGGVREL